LFILIADQPKSAFAIMTATTKTTSARKIGKTLKPEKNRVSAASKKNKNDRLSQDKVISKSHEGSNLY
jgi:hypothetical protein